LRDASRLRLVVVAIVAVSVVAVAACEKTKERTPDAAAIAAAVEQARREDAEADRRMRERAAQQELARRDAEQAAVDDRVARENARSARQLQLEQRVRDLMVDPSSMQIRGQRLNADGTALCAEVNGKNKQGSYVGFRRTVVMDNVVSFDQDPDDSYRRPEHQFPALAALTGCF
jgi:type IV secretory pathway VirB10-like protein